MPRLDVPTHPRHYPLTITTQIDGPCVRVGGLTHVLLGKEANVILWNHEDASATATGFDLVTVLDTSLDYGLGWLDFYSDGSYLLAKDRQGELLIGSHWHWTQPLILGGPVTAKNMTAVERVQHLIGHAQLWLQVRGIPPGGRFVPRNSNEVKSSGPAS
jgi:hypothetical protein